MAELLFKPGSPSRQIMNISYFLAPYPLRYIEYMPGSYSNNRAVCLRLRKDGYLNREKLNSKAYVTMGEGLPEEPYAGADDWYMVSKTNYRHLPEVKARNINMRRADGIALAGITMIGAGAAAIPSEKPVFGSEGAKPGRYYYHAREVKNVSEGVGERQARLAGVLINGYDIYHVFAQYKKAGILSKASELKQWQNTLRQTRNMFGRKIDSMDQNAIVVSEYDTFPESVINAENKGYASNFTMFTNLYFFNVHKNKEHLKLFLDGALKKPVIPDEERDDNTGIYAASYQHRGDYIFEYFEPNVSKLIKFFYGVSLRDSKDQKNYIYCFDFQKEQLKNLARNTCKIKTFSIEEYLAATEK